MADWFESDRVLVLFRDFRGVEEYRRSSVVFTDEEGIVVKLDRGGLELVRWDEATRESEARPIINLDDQARATRGR